MCGGFGAFCSWQRNYNFQQFTDMLTKANTSSHLVHGSYGIRARQAHAKMEYSKSQSLTQHVSKWRKNWI